MRMRSVLDRVLRCRAMASLYGWLQKAGKQSPPLLPSPSAMTVCKNYPSLRALSLALCNA